MYLNCFDPNTGIICQCHLYTYWLRTPNLKLREKSLFILLYVNMSPEV